MDMQELKEGMLKRPRDFAYFGDLDLNVWGFAPFGKHRDSDLLQESNFDVALKELKRVSGKSVEVMHTNHWAVGWYDHIMVRTTAKKTMEKVLELCNRLDNYPILNEEDYSEREFNQACDAYDQWARSSVAQIAQENEIARLLDEEGDYDPRPEDEEQVKSIVAHAIMDYDSAEGTYRDSDLIQMLVEAFPPLDPEADTLTLPLPY